MPIARSEATWRSHIFLEEIATLPPVASNDKVTIIIAFVLVFCSIIKESEEEGHTALSRLKKG
jgi:hypothetical protein